MFESLKKKVADKLFDKETVKATITSSKSVIANPLGMQVGSNFTVKNNSSIIYKGLFQKQPEYTVKAIGVFEMNSAVKGYRFYASKDKTTIAPADSFLQILVSKRDNTIEEVRMFSFLEEDYPTNNLQWKIWLGEEGSKIGKFDAEFAGRDFARLEAWARGNAEWVPAFEFRETVLEDNGGVTSNRISHESMLYGRWLHEEHQIAEFLLMSAEETHIDGSSTLYRAGNTTVSGIVMFAGMDVDIKEIVINY